MELLAMALAREVPQLKKDGVRVCFVGERAGLSPKVRDGLAQAEAATAENTRLVLNVCFNYGGRWDIAQAAASLAAFAWLLTLHPCAAGRTYAAYGGVYVVVALIWLWRVDGVVPTRWDLIGGAICLAGMAIIALQPRTTS